MVARALGPEPGPVHINVPARKPLEPSADPGLQDQHWAEAVADVSSRPLHPARATRPVITESDLRAVAAMVRQAERPLVVCGPTPGFDRHAARAITQLADAIGGPVLAEVTSGLRHGPARPRHLVSAFDLVLQAVLSPGDEPDLIVQLGRPPVSAAWDRYQATLPRVARVVIADAPWADPTGHAERVLTCDVTDAAQRLAQLAVPGGSSAWTDSWLGAGEVAAAAFERAIREDGAAALIEHAAVAAVAAALPDPCQLVLGNSLPIRISEWALAGDQRDLRVLCQRGAAGIDGLVAGAFGSAAAAGLPTCLLLGDVSFAHDVSALAAARHASVPLAIVVIDNVGGRIFDQLPIARLDGAGEIVERFFTTPPAIDVAAVAAAYGVRFAEARAASAVSREVGKALSHVGLTVIHVSVEPDSARRLQAQIASALEAR